MKHKGFQLSPLTLNHIEFVNGLYENETISEEQAVQLVADALREMPASVRNILLPMNKDVYRCITDHLAHGTRKIAIWADGSGKRYVAAEAA